MTKARLDGLLLLLLGSLVFISLGAVLENSFRVTMVDFKVLYYPARCLIQHGDPYNESEVAGNTRSDGGDPQLATATDRQVVTRYLYPPTTFPLTVPFAMLPFKLAHILWMVLTMGSFVLASYLIWNLGASYAPVLSGILVGFLLANSELLVVTGNAAGIAISLCVVAVWCFIRERLVPVGVLCLAISLMVKPHDSSLVWLFFLLAGGAFTKRALQALLAAVALSLPAVLWVWYVAPHWVRELGANLAAFSVHGGMNDPGLASAGAHGLGMLVSLQAVFGVFWDDPRFYNPASYLVCAPLLAVWAYITLRSRTSPAKVWLALAAVAALSMLPVYHRQLDTKLLLLTVPACAMLWAEGGLIGRLALLMNTAGFVLTGELPWAIILGLISYIQSHARGLSEYLLRIAQVLPVPLALLAMAVFYLWVYARRCSAQISPEPAKGQAEGLGHFWFYRRPVLKGHGFSRAAKLQ
jgi:hypothetical protein